VKRVFILLYLFLVICPFGFAQGNDASLTGSITDQSHAAVANAKVTVRNKIHEFYANRYGGFLRELFFLELADRKL